ncbi:MAG TPA: hypothetical protein VNK43_11045 [Gemmatimonadales bacterium]|nr:hypothetical protein [Gemmatimonadales bacterium]
MTRKHLLALGATVFLAACGGGDDKDPTGPGNPGQPGFSATVTGDLEGDMNGTASFAQVTDPDLGSVFQLTFTETGDEGTMLFVTPGQRPGQGTYDVVASEEPAAGEFVIVIYSGDPDDPDAFFLGQAGTVTFSASSGNQVKGTFEFDALGVVMEDPETELAVTVSGSFTANAGAPGGVISDLKLEPAR